MFGTSKRAELKTEAEPSRRMANGVMAGMHQPGGQSMDRALPLWGIILSGVRNHPQRKSALSSSAGRTEGAGHSGERTKPN